MTEVYTVLFRPRYCARKRTFEEFLTGHNNDTIERYKKRNCIVRCTLLVPMCDFNEALIVDEDNQIITRCPYRYLSNKPICVTLDHSALQEVDFFVRQLFGYLSAQSIHHAAYQVTVSDVQLAILAVFASRNDTVAKLANQAGLSKLETKYFEQGKSLCMVKRQALKYPTYAVHQELSIDASPKIVSMDTSLYMSGVLEFFARELCNLCCRNVLTSCTPYVVSSGTVNASGCKPNTQRCFLSSWRMYAVCVTHWMVHSVYKL